jgi:hypothetical protein
LKIEFGVLFAYAVCASLITVLWTLGAQTETQKNQYNSIVAIADGTAQAPFVWRRLVFDAARFLARIVPTEVWRATERDSRLSRVLGDRLGWKPEQFPILFSTTALIGLSAFGFMLVSRAMVVRLYQTPPWLPGLAGMILGFALLGGGGHRHYQWYPYDIPNAFVFALTLAGFLADRRWSYLAFAVACYSKETAFLLIVARWLLRTDRRTWLHVSQIAGMLAVFVMAQLFIRVRYDNPGAEGWWFLGRNLRLLLWTTLFDSWFIPMAIVGLARIRASWAWFPWELRRLTVIPGLLITAAIFKGWFEERRQYTEALSIFGPLLIQWVLLELGLGYMMVARRSKPGASRTALLAKMTTGPVEA